MFGKKKLSLDEILNGLDDLTPEEKDKVKAKMDDLYKAEDEREIDKIEEKKADDTEVKDEKSEEKQEETEEIGKDVDEVESEVTDGETAAETEEKADETENEEKPEETEEPAPAEEPAEKSVEKPEPEESAEEKEAKKELDDAQSARISAIEENQAKMMELLDNIMERLENKDFGANPSAPESNEETSERQAAVMRGYAGAKARDYL